MNFDATAMKLRAAFLTGDLRACLTDRLKELEVEADGISRDIDSGRDGHDGVTGQTDDSGHGSTDGGQSASAGSGESQG